MKELSKSLIFQENQKKKINKYNVNNRTNLIEFDNYFKYSGMIEYKKRFILAEDRYEYMPYEREIVCNDMSKYKFKKKLNETS
tara:strand:- start:3164 stop:3412 length:249 start_codon:yes stop_codon:yes gene_type:complete